MTTIDFARQTRQIRRWMTSAALAAACILGSPITGLADPAAPPAPQGEVRPPAAMAPAQAGQWIHVDPLTGKRVPAPPSAAVAGRPEFSTSHQGLVEKPAPGGGIMIDIQGRFRHAATATVGADGKPVADCVPPGTTEGRE